METHTDRIQIIFYTRPDCSLCEEMKVGRKAFKYRVTEQELRQRLDRALRMRPGGDQPPAQ